LFPNILNNNIPIVHGYATEQQYTSAATEDYGANSFNGQKGNPQPKKFNDVFFAVLFYVHLAVMLVYALPMSINAQAENEGGNGGNFGSIIYFVSVCSLIAVGLSTLSLGFMMKFGRQLVQLALYFYIGFSFVVMIIMFMAGSMLMGGLCALSFAISICYARAVQSRIPFAAANLNSALTAVRANLGLTAIAYVFMFAAFGYAIAWTTISNVVLDAYPGMAFLLFLSFYWTQQVLKNTMHVTTAGVIGTWWFAPDEASSYCSRSIGDSFVRSTTYSFGSICFGSLIVALIQALRQLNRHLRENRDAQLLVCLIDCILGCVEGLIEYFNKWAYVYVGLYGKFRH
jgi:hypothetical protein